MQTGPLTRFSAPAGALALVALAAVVAATPAKADPAVGPAAATATAAGAFAGGAVPDGTCRVALSGLGGAGGSTSSAGGSGGRGGAPAQIGATFAVLPLQTYSGSVGGGGQITQTGGVGGGGDGGSIVQGHPGAGGGGRTVITLAGQTVLVAGGGGGGGAAHQAAPAGEGGAAGTAVGAGTVGVGSDGGDGVDNPAVTVGGGQGGQAATGGAGGAHATTSSVDGTAGGGTSGGDGGDGGADPNWDSGGGGGAGYTGGGGGSSTTNQSVSGAGGGGGSSWVAAASPVVSAAAPTSVAGTLGTQTAAGSFAGADGQAALDWLPCLYDLQLSQTVSPSSAASGSTLTWTITITNNGTDPMTRGDLVSLTNTLPGPATTVTSISTSGGTNADLTRGAVTCTGVTVGSPMPASTTCSRPYAGVGGTPQSPSGGSRGLDPGETLTIVYTQALTGVASGTALANTASVKDRPTQSGTTDIVGNVTTDSIVTTANVVNPIVASNDSGSVTSASGGVAVANVLVNDTLSGVAATTSSVTITAVGAVPAGLSLNASSGAVSVAAGTAAGVYAFDYRICEAASASNCATATVTVTVTAVAASPPASPPAAPSANLSIAKGGPAEALPGDTVSYSLTARNAGPDTATSVVVTDPLPTGLTLVAGSATVSGAAGATCAESGPTVRCTVPSLASGATVVVALRATVGAAAGAVVVNQASVAATTSDPDSADNASPHRLTVAARPKPAPSPAPSPARPGPPKAAPAPKPKPKRAPAVPATLKVAKEALVDGAVRPGQTFRYRITVTDTSRSTATGVRVCDVPSTDLVFVRAPGATFSDGTACWDVAGIAAGGSRTFVVTVRLDADAKPGRLRNDATATGANVKGAAVSRARAVVAVKGAVAKGRSGGVTG